jgi:glutamate synthase domain-containing protein 3
MAPLTRPPGTGPAAVEVDGRGRSTREINQTLRASARGGAQRVDVLHPGARHNLAVALFGDVEVTLRGSAGYYCAGMIDGPDVVVEGNCATGVGEGMMSGRIRVKGHAGGSAGAAVRGGTLIVEGDAGARVGIGMKGGLIVVGGAAGYMTGFMMQRGTIVICGDAGEALGDSMYEGRIYAGGRIGGLGHDAVERPLDGEDGARLGAALAALGREIPLSRFRRIESGRRLWNFSTREMGLWRTVL